MSSAARRSCAGHTLVELLIAAAILVVLVGLPMRLLDTSTSAQRSENATAALDEEARRVLDRIAERLTLAGGSNVTQPAVPAPASSPGIDFQAGLGFQGGAVVLGNQERFELLASPGDPDDGLDNDGDGLVDEGRVAWVRNVGPNQRVTILCDDVPEYLEGEVPGNGVDENGNALEDERGLCFVFTTITTTAGGVLKTGVIVRLTLSQTNGGAAPTLRTVERTIAFRNQ